MSPSILFRFAAAKSFETLSLPNTNSAASFVRGWEVKQAIVKTKRLDVGRRAEFDLSVLDARTNREYGEDDLVPLRAIFSTSHKEEEEEHDDDDEFGRGGGRNNHGDNIQNNHHQQDSTRLIVKRLPVLVRGRGLLARLARRRDACGAPPPPHPRDASVSPPPQKNAVVPSPPSMNNNPYVIEIHDEDEFVPISASPLANGANRTVSEEGPKACGTRGGIALSTSSKKRPRNDPDCDFAAAATTTTRKRCRGIPLVFRTTGTADRGPSLPPKAEKGSHGRSRKYLTGLLMGNRPGGYNNMMTNKRTVGPVTNLEARHDGRQGREHPGVSGRKGAKNGQRNGDRTNSTDHRMLVSATTTTDCGGRRGGGAMSSVLVDIPEYLTCAICHGLARDAVLIPWDPQGRTTCEDCIRGALPRRRDGSNNNDKNNNNNKNKNKEKKEGGDGGDDVEAFFVCPLTKKVEGVNPDSLLPNHGLRKAISAFVAETTSRIVTTTSDVPKQGEEEPKREDPLPTTPPPPPTTTTTTTTTAMTEKTSEEGGGIQPSKERASCSSPKSRVVPTLEEGAIRKLNIKRRDERARAQLIATLRGRGGPKRQ